MNGRLAAPAGEASLSVGESQREVGVCPLELRSRMPLPGAKQMRMAHWRGGSLAYPKHTGVVR